MNKLKTYEDPVLDRQIQALCRELEQPTHKAIILVSPDRNKWKVTVSNAGTLSITAL